MSEAREPIGQAVYRGQTVSIFPPGLDLWRRLDDLRSRLKKNGFMEHFWPGFFASAVLAAVAECCSSIPTMPLEPVPGDDRSRYWWPTIEGYKLIDAILDTWDDSYYWVARYKAFVMTLQERSLEARMKAQDKLDLFVNPHPELRYRATEEGIADADFGPEPDDLWIDPDEAEEPPGAESVDGPDPGATIGTRSRDAEDKAPSRAPDTVQRPPQKSPGRPKPHKRDGSVKRKIEDYIIGHLRAYKESRDSGDEYPPLPTQKDIAKTLKVSESMVSRIGRPLLEKNRRLICGDVMRGWKDWKTGDMDAYDRLHKSGSDEQDE
jgi:hypothetical protein